MEDYRDDAYAMRPLSMARAKGVVSEFLNSSSDAVTRKCVTVYLWRRYKKIFFKIRIDNSYKIVSRDCKTFEVPEVV